jgi:hypothetical protein
MIDTIYDIGPDKLKDKKIELLLIDLDNTMSPYSISEPSPGLIRWADDIKKAGIDLFIISNSRSERPRIFAEALGIGYINRARNPSLGDPTSLEHRAPHLKKNRNNRRSDLYGCTLRTFAWNDGNCSQADQPKKSTACGALSVGVALQTCNIR